MPKIKRNDPAPLVQTGKPVLYDQDLDPAPVRAARTPKPKRSGVGYTVAPRLFCAGVCGQRRRAAEPAVAGQTD